MEKINYKGELITTDLVEHLVAFSFISIDYIHDIRVLKMKNTDAHNYRRLSEFSDDLYEVCLNNNIKYIYRESKIPEQYKLYKINSKISAVYLPMNSENDWLLLSRETKLLDIISS